MPVAVLAQHAVRPAARGLRNPWPEPVGSCVGIRQVAEPSTADRIAGRTGEYVEHLGGVDGRHRHRRRDDGARAEPLADQCGGRGHPAPGRSIGDGVQHRRRAAQVAESLDPHQVSVTENYRLISRGMSTPASLSGLRIA